MGQLLRKFNAVTGLSGWSDPNKASLTDLLPTLRADLHEILRAGVSSVDPFRLVNGSVRSRRPRSRSPTDHVTVIAAGKAAWLMAAAAFNSCRGQRVRAVTGIVAGPKIAAADGAGVIRMVRCFASVAGCVKRSGGATRAVARR